MYGSLGLVRDRRDMLRACHKINTTCREEPPMSTSPVVTRRGSNGNKMIMMKQEPRQLATSSSPCSPTTLPSSTSFTSMIAQFTPFSTWTEEWDSERYPRRGKKRKGERERDTRKKEYNFAKSQFLITTSKIRPHDHLLSHPFSFTDPLTPV